MSTSSLEQTKPTSTQLFALSAMFSPGVFAELSTNGKSKKLADLLHLAQVRPSRSNSSVAEVLEAAFSVLKRRGLRDEYVYRSAIAQKVLLGKHSLNTSTMLTEFRTGASKADVVVLNGHASVYEIKSERDSLTKLDKQLRDYCKVFASVNVITSEKYAPAVLDMTEPHIGVLCLSSRYQISTLRQPEYRPEKTDTVSVLESVRRAEAENILKEIGIDAPVVPNTQRLTAMRKVFSKLDPTVVQEAMVTELKQSRSQVYIKETVERVPPALQAAVLSSRTKPPSYSKLFDALATPAIQAMCW